MSFVGSLDAIAKQLHDASDRSRVSCDDFLAIERGRYYAQLLFNRDAVFGEVVSNTFLSGPDRLTTVQEHRLRTLGWTPPGVPCHSRCERAHPNFHRVWLDATPTGDIVRDLLLAFLNITRPAEGELLTLVGGFRIGTASTGLPCNH